MTFKRLAIVLAILTALARVFVAPRLTNIPTFEGSYEALAHMLVGFLIIVPFYDRRAFDARTFGWLGWGLALWEAAWFLGEKWWFAHL